MTAKTEKNFLVQDLSGRGYANTLSETDLRDRWDLEQLDDDEDITLGDFIETAELGDEWQEFTVKITRI